MPADMNDYFKKKKPTMNKSTPGGGNGGGGNNFDNPLNNLGKGGPFIIAIIVIAVAMFVLKPFTIINSG